MTRSPIKAPILRAFSLLNLLRGRLCTWTHTSILMKSSSSHTRYASHFWQRRRLPLKFHELELMIFSRSSNLRKEHVRALSFSWWKEIVSCKFQAEVKIDRIALKLNFLTIRRFHNHLRVVRGSRIFHIV